MEKENTNNHLKIKAAKDYIKKNISIPLVADIHFDYRLAITSIEYVIIFYSMIIC